MATANPVNLSGWYEHPDGVRYDGNYPLSARLSGRQNLVHEDLFDGGTLDLTRYYGSGNTPTVGTIVGGALDGQDVMTVFLDHDNSTTSYRTEVTSDGWSGTTGFTDDISAEIGATIWYGISIYIPSDWIPDTLAGGFGTGEILTQWHGRPDVAGGEAYRNPNVALELDEDTYLLRIKGDSKLNTGNPPVYERSNTYTLPNLISATKGAWTNWVWRIKWGYDNTGELDLYQDGVLVHTETGLANCYNDPDKGPYLKFGLYKWPWKVDRPDTSIQTRTYYFDNFRVGNSNATLSDVWEDHS